GPNFSSKSSSTTLSVMDGEYAWNLNEFTDGPQKGQKSATKMKIDYSLDPYKSMKDVMDLKVLPDEKVDGQDCYVLEGKPKGPAGSSADDGVTVMYFRKACGLEVKAVSYMGGKPSSTITMSDIKLNASVPDDHFKFKVPDGVEVQDIDKMRAADQGGTPTPAEGDKKA